MLSILFRLLPDILTASSHFYIKWRRLGSNAINIQAMIAATQT